MLQKIFTENSAKIIDLKKNPKTGIFEMTKKIENPETGKKQKNRKITEMEIAAFLQQTQKKVFAAAGIL